MTSPTPGPRFAMTFIALGALLSASAVALGAFGAHALRGTVSPRHIAIWDTASEYHLIHGVSVVVVGALGLLAPRTRGLRLAGWLLIAGCALFAGSLYALVLTGIGVLGALTPVGGVLLIAGWLCLAIAAFTAVRTPRNPVSHSS